MDDREIVSLYLSRNETAIHESDTKYGRYLHTVAYNVLYSHEDCKECVNDTYMQAWNAIPPQKPTALRAFLGKIARNLAINRYHRDRAQKRAGQVDVIIDEYWECIPDGAMLPEDAVILKDAVNGFLSSLPKKSRILFVQRYWYMCPIKEIAERNGMSETNVKVTLLRTREKCKQYLLKEGVLSEKEVD